MRYPEAAADYFAAHEADESVSLNQLLLMRAADQALPDSVHISGSNVAINGKLAAGPTSTLASIVQVPGMRFVQLYADPNLSFRVASNPPPARFLRNFTLSDIAGDIGATNVRFVRNMIAMYSAKLKSTGLFGDQEVARLIALANAGVVAIPSTPTRIKIVNPSHPVDLLEPANLDAQSRSSWYTICEAFAAIYSLYLKGALKEAADAVEAANANADLWDVIYTVVEDVRDAPANLVAGAGSALFSAIGWKNWLLLGGIGIVAGGIYFGWFRGLATVAAKAVTVK